MRTTLKDLEGKLVVFTGWETSLRHERTWICLSRVSVKVWDRNSAVNDPANRKNALRLDHLWLSGDKQRNEAQQVDLYGRVGGIGVVRKYQRLNGSWDYTVKSPANRKSIEDFVDAYNDCFDELDQKERLEAIESALEQIEHHSQGSEQIVFGMAKSVSKFKKELLAQKLDISRSIAATDKTLKTATMNGKCKSLNLVTFEGQQPLLPKGF